MTNLEGGMETLKSQIEAQKKICAEEKEKLRSDLEKANTDIASLESTLEEMRKFDEELKSQKLILDEKIKSLEELLKQQGSDDLKTQLEAQKKAFVLDVGEELGVYLEKPQPYIPIKKQGRGRTPTAYVCDAPARPLKELWQHMPAAQWQTITHRQATKGPLTRKAVMARESSFLQLIPSIAEQKTSEI